MSETDSNRHGPPSVINVGLMRTGTMSMARAYDILGLRAHHGLDMGDLPGRGSSQWAAIEEAAEATWLTVPGARRRRRGARFTRAEWDAVFGSYDAVTDVGSLFAEQLVKAYRPRGWSSCSATTTPDGRATGPRLRTGCSRG